MRVCSQSLRRAWLFATPWTVAHQALPSVGFSRQEYWSGLPFPPPGDLLNPGIEPRSPALQADSLPAEPQGKPKNTGVGRLSLLQGIFPTQEPNQGLLPCRWILYQLSYQGRLIGDIRSYYFKLVSLDFFISSSLKIFYPMVLTSDFSFWPCCVACGIWVSLTRHWTQGPQQWELRVLSTEPPRNALTSFEMILSWITYYQDGCKTVIFGFVIPFPFIHWCSSLKKNFPFSFKTLFSFLLHVSSAGGTSLIPGQRTKIPHVAQRSPTKKKS